MKAFTNVNARDLTHAAGVIQEARKSGRAASLAGGGSDLLALVKDHLVEPDVLINLKTIDGLDQVEARGGGVQIGGLTTLDQLSRHPVIRRDYPVLAEAAESVATPQIRNVATLAGNVCQRPWCWYFRNGFPCLKNGGNACFAASGENQFHAIFGGGPSHIVHPSDTAPALVALDATFIVMGPKGERRVPSSEFFTLPRQDPRRENVLAGDDILAAVELPSPGRGVRATYHKVLDREAWTHAVVSLALVLDMDRETCRSSRLVLGGVAPIPWRLANVEQLLAGRQITPEVAAQAGEAAVKGATPLAKNGYKVPLTNAIVRRTLLSLAGRA